MKKDSKRQSIIDLRFQNAQRNAINVLKTSPEARTQVELNILVDVLKDTKFVKERDLADKLISMLAIEMEYLFAPRDQRIFEYNSKGDLFYIIIKGCVSVLIPFGSKPRCPTPTNSPPKRYQRGLTLLLPPEETSRRQKSFHNMELESIIFKQVAQLSSGTNFGELALTTNKPRTARIKAIEDTHLGILKRSTYFKILNVIEENKLDQLTDFLSSTPYFKSCEKRTLHKLQYYFIRKHLEKNQIIYTVGDQPKNIYLVYKGEVEMNMFIPKPQNKKAIIRNSSQKAISTIKIKTGAKKIGNSLRQDGIQHIRGDNAKIKCLGKGQFFGEEDLLHDRRHTATVICKSLHAVLLQISSMDFQRWILSIEEVANYFQIEIKRTDQLSIQRATEFLKYRRNKEKLNDLPGRRSKGKTFMLKMNPSSIISYSSLTEKTENPKNIELIKDTNISPCRDEGNTQRKYQILEVNKSKERKIKRLSSLKNELKKGLTFNKSTNSLFSAFYSLNNSGFSNLYDRSEIATIGSPRPIFSPTKPVNRTFRNIDNLNNITNKDIINEDIPTDILTPKSPGYFASTPLSPPNISKTSDSDYESTFKSSNLMIKNIIKNSIKRTKDQIHYSINPNLFNRLKGSISMEDIPIPNNPQMSANINTNTQSIKMSAKIANFLVQKVNSCKIRAETSSSPCLEAMVHTSRNNNIKSTKSINSSLRKNDKFYVSNLHLIQNNLDSTVKKKSRKISEQNSVLFEARGEGRELDKFTYDHKRLSTSQTKQKLKLNYARLKEILIHRGTFTSRNLKSPQSYTANSNLVSLVVMPQAFAASPK